MEFAALFTLLAFGTGWFWLYIALWFMLLTAFVENEKAGSAISTLIIGLAIVVFLGNHGWINWVKTHSLDTLKWVGVYVAAGAGWGITKWWLFLRKHRRSYLNFREKFEKEAKQFRARTRREDAELAYNVRRGRKGQLSASEQEDLQAEIDKAFAVPVPEGFDTELFKRYAKTYGYSLKDALQLRAVDNKGRIVFWMTYWPSSMFWWIVNDPVTRLFNFVYRRLSGVFDAMSNHVFGKYRDELGDLN